MAKKKRGRKMPAWRKWAKAGFSIAGKLLGGVVAVSPAERGIRNLMGGDLGGAGRNLLYDFTGIDAGAGTFNANAAISGVGRVVGGIVIMKLFGYLARSV